MTSFISSHLGASTVPTQLCRGCPIALIFPAQHLSSVLAPELYPSCWEAMHLNRWFFQQCSQLYLIEPGDTCFSSYTKELWRASQAKDGVWGDIAQRAHSSWNEWKHCSFHGSWDTPTPVVETQRWGSFILWISLSRRGLHSVWKPAVVECKREGRANNTCFSEHDNQGESQLAARQCSLLRAQKGSYSGQCEAGWDQGMIMTVSKRSSAGHE